MPNKTMDLKLVYGAIIRPAALLLPPHLNLAGARATLLTAGLQESKFSQRQQLVGNHPNWWESLAGPATSYWQFERPTIQLLLDHRKTGPLLKAVLATLGYPTDAKIIHHAIVHNDLLACTLARLLLLTYPGPLPKQGDPDEGWKQYFWCWKPGTPHPERWGQYYYDAWQIEASE